MPEITSTYAALLGVLFLILSVRVITRRRGRRVAFGTGGDGDLERRVRIQANFAEYVPLALLLIFFAELRGADAAVVHALCLMLVAGRVAHAVGLSSPRSDGFGRIAGMTGTQTAILGAVIAILAT